MNGQTTICAVCRNVAELAPKLFDGARYNCICCGEFAIIGSAQTVLADPKTTFWNAVRRAGLSHKLATNQLPINKGLLIQAISDDDLRAFEQRGLSLPTPSRQVDNLILWIGKSQRLSGGKVNDFSLKTVAIIGSESIENATEWLSYLKKEDLVQFREYLGWANSLNGLSIQLTLKGWRRWEEIQKGAESLRTGFVALDFKDKDANRFINEIVRPRLRDALSVDVVRGDDSSSNRAGVIDSIMREMIAESNFVLAEISKGNIGAHWEAGYAEGLGKPVIYLYEKAIAGDKLQMPHFDVRNLTSIVWDKDDPEACIPQLIATIKNSLRQRGQLPPTPPATP